MKRAETAAISHTIPKTSIAASSADIAVKFGNKRFSMGTPFPGPVKLIQAHDRQQTCLRDPALFDNNG